MNESTVNEYVAAKLMQDALEKDGYFTEVAVQDFDGNRSLDFVFTYNYDTRNAIPQEILADITRVLGPSSDKMTRSYDKAVVLIGSDVWIGSAEDLRLCYIMVLENEDDETLGNCVLNNWYLISE